MKPVATVFIDTNILKFSAVKKHVFQPRIATVNWGGSDFEMEYFERHTANDLLRIKHDVQRRDAIALPMLAYAGISDWIKFYYHREVLLESSGLPRMRSASGSFFGCTIHKVPDPHTPRSRIISGGEKKLREHTSHFLNGLEDRRFIELTRATGAYQGTSQTLNLNQGLDAYHIWCAENAKINYFLTMDYKLKKMVEKSRIDTSVRVVTPTELIKLILPRFGFVAALIFVWKGYRFAKSHLDFDEGKGWS